MIFIIISFIMKVKFVFYYLWFSLCLNKERYNVMIFRYFYIYNKCFDGWNIIKRKLKNVLDRL